MCHTHMGRFKNILKLKHRTEHHEKYLPYTFWVSLAFSYFLFLKPWTDSSLNSNTFSRSALVLWLVGPFWCFYTLVPELANVHCDCSQRLLNLTCFELWIKSFHWIYNLEIFFHLCFSLYIFVSVFPNKLWN